MAPDPASGAGPLGPAGTIRYWQAWAFMAVLFVPMTAFALYMLRHNPSLLERRMRTREIEPEQKRIVAATSLVLLATFVLPGLDRRLGWSSVPVWLAVAANLTVLLGYLLFVRVLRENEYAGRTVEVEEGQHLISTGPYGVVRHPLYLAAILIFCLAPLALGSYWGLIPAALLALGFGSAFASTRRRRPSSGTCPGTPSTARRCGTG